jgi:poly-gamma-glutamate capsule biosynthesis protein CapA/YwtB (metallophosphatase superfamily)
MKTFKEFVNEGKMTADDAMDALFAAMDKGDAKFDQALWDMLEPLGDEKGIYAGDATPDEIISALDDKEVLNLHKELSKKFKKLF